MNWIQMDRDRAQRLAIANTVKNANQPCGYGEVCGAVGLCSRFVLCCVALQVAAQTQQPGRRWTDPSQPVHWGAALRACPPRPRLLRAGGY